MRKIEKIEDRYKKRRKSVGEKGQGREIQHHETPQPKQQRTDTAF